MTYNTFCSCDALGAGMISYDTDGIVNGTTASVSSRSAT